MLTLKSITIRDYRSFTSQTMTFENLTCIVGANESGKTNVIEAIDHLQPSKQHVPYSPDELRVSASKYPAAPISISYTFRINSALANLPLEFPDLTGRTVVLTKSGEPGQQPKWACSSEIPMSLIPRLIKIHKKTIYQNSLGSNKRHQENRTRGWFIPSSTEDFRTNPYKHLTEIKVLEQMKGKQLKTFFHELLLGNFLDQVNIHRWAYNEDNFLKEIVPIDEFLANPDKFISVKNIFILAGWTQGQFRARLKNQSPHAYTNILKAASREINSLIKRNWKTHPNLTINIQHNGNFLAITLNETGASTPPQFRSDGLKWFLTFLINFRAISKDLQHFILLIDEPGHFLHPRGQKDVLNELVTLSKKNQVIYSTHQPFMINRNDPAGVRILTRETDKKGPQAKNPFFATTVSNSPLTAKHIMTDGLLRTALGFQVSDISPINDKNILVEGVFDREILMIMNEKWKILDVNDVSIIACSGASEIYKYANLYKTNGLKCVGLYDSDSLGLSWYKKSAEVLVASEIFHVAEFSVIQKSHTMEDLIADEEFQIALTEWIKISKIEVTKNIDRPRMTALDRFLPNDKFKRMEFKHSLEDILGREVRSAVEISSTNYDLFPKLLMKLRDALG